jgi:hypothetical protein
MKVQALLFGIAACFAAQLALANATATSVTGTVQAQSATAAARAVQPGDVVREGDTVTTGANSSAILRFEDGQIVGLASNSAMKIAKYKFDSATGGGNILLNLVKGGMRAVSGLIARANPANVIYQAANVTVGIRGTDANLFNGPNGVVATVGDGSITFSAPGKETVIISAGEAGFLRSDGAFTSGAAPLIASALQNTPGGPDMLAALNGLQGLSVMLAGTSAGQATGLTLTPGPPPGGSTVGGGAASAR